MMYNDFFNPIFGGNVVLSSIITKSLVISCIIIITIILLFQYYDFFSNNKENIPILIFILGISLLLISDKHTANYLYKIGGDILGTNLSGSEMSGSEMSGNDISVSEMSGNDISVSEMLGNDISVSEISESGVTGGNIFGNNKTNNTIIDCIHDDKGNCIHNIIGGENNDKYMKEALLDPRHNLKEVAEQLILLEDHLAHPRRRCRDCITKHYLTIEAFLREAITLDKEHKHFDEIQDLLNSIKPAMVKVLQKLEKNKITNQDYLETCQILRENRKKIMIPYALYN